MKLMVASNNDFADFQVHFYNIVECHFVEGWTEWPEPSGPLGYATE